MLDFLSEEKQDLIKTQRNLLVAKKYCDMQLKSATDQTKTFLGSPAGIGTAFAAGALKGTAVNVPTPPLSSLFTLLSRLL